MHSLLLLMASICILAAFLYLPGYLVLKVAKANNTLAFAASPLVSIFLFEVLAILAAKARFALPLHLICVVLFLLPALLFVFTQKKRGKLKLPKLNFSRVWIYPALVIVGVGICYYVFLKSVGDLNNIAQNYDYFFHLNTVRDMANSLNFSPLGVDFYREAKLGYAAPWVIASFYPAAWHAYTALLILILKVSAPAAITLSVAAIACAIYPLGIYFLAREILEPKPVKLQRFNVAVLVFSLASTAFPWMLIYFGPLYPNVFGYSILPYFMFFVVYSLKRIDRLKDLLPALPLLFIGLIALAVAHPNTVFSAYLLLMPYVVYSIYHKLDGSAFKKRLVVLGFLALYALVWVGAYNLPALHEIVQHSWGTYTFPIQAAMYVVSLNYTYAFSNADPALYALMPFVAIGFYVMAKNTSKRWITISYVLTAFILIYSVSYLGEIRQLLAGFWYTDPVRISAMLGIVSIIFAIQGFMTVIDVLSYLSQKLPGKTKISAQALLMTTAALVMLAAYIPNFNWPGIKQQEMEYENPRTHQKETNNYSIYTAMGELRRNLRHTYEWQNPLTDGERVFLAKVEDIVGDDLVINSPIDGSFMAYGTNNLNIYYRKFLGQGSPFETKDSEIIRTKLYQLGQNPEVEESLKHVGAKYVMLLDKTDSEWSFINLRSNYLPDEFYGIYSVSETTPHLELVLADKHCYLYKIVY